MTITFKVIAPKKLDSKVFEKAFMDASKEMAGEVHKDFNAVTEKWHDTIAFEEKVVETSQGIEVSVMTSDKIFKYYDQGNGGPQRIIRPTHSSVLHWVDKNTGEEFFRKWVHGYEGRKAVDKIEKIWLKKAPILFNKAMAEAVSKSGHKI